VSCGVVQQATRSAVRRVNWAQEPYITHTHFAVNHNRLFIHFKGHFPGEPGLADTRRYGIVEFNIADTRMSPLQILLELRMMDVVVNTGAIKRAKLHLHQAFYSRHN